MLMMLRIIFLICFVSLNIERIECVRTEPKIVELVEGFDTYEILFKSEFVGDIGTCSLKSNSSLVSFSTDYLYFDEIGSSLVVFAKVTDDEYGRKFSTATITVTVICQEKYLINMIYYDNDVPISISLPEVLSKGDDGYKTVITVDEDGDGKKFDTQCSFEFSPVGVISTSFQNDLSAIISADHPTEVQFSVVRDTDLENNITVLLTIRCPPHYEYASLTQTILVEKDNPVNGEDPQFSQVVLDSVTNDLQRICYDIIFESNKKVLLYKNTLAKTLIFGKFLDDHHMHEINLQSPEENITIATYSIKLNNQFNFEWTSSIKMQWITTKNYLIRFDNNVIQIEDYIKKGEQKRLKLLINRQSLPYGNRILRVNFPNLNNYENIDGLFGKIGNNKYKFYNLASGMKILESGTVAINGLYSTAFRVKKENENCWFINVKDSLKPHEINYFLY